MTYISQWYPKFWTIVLLLLLPLSNPQTQKLLVIRQWGQSKLTEFKLQIAYITLLFDTIKNPVLALSLKSPSNEI